MKRNYLILAIVITFASGCYDMKQDDKGRTIKVNRITGEISVIAGDKIVKLKNEKELRMEQEAAKKLGEPKRWPQITLPIVGGTKANIVTKWSDGFLYYQFFIDKNLRGKGNYLARLNIEFYDSASFLLEAIPVQVSIMTASLGPNGKTIEAMQYKDQKLMTEDTYKKISGWDITWAGFNK